MNSWFNFQIPYFNSQFGSDWGSFNTIVEDNVDYIMNKTFDLYKINDITTKPVIALDYSIRLRDIETESSESIALKKRKLREFNSVFKSKALSEIYLDYQEDIVGTRGEIYNGYLVNIFSWGDSSWAVSGSPDTGDWIWASGASIFYIYIDVKTTDSGLLDEIVNVYRLNYMLPAFYKIFLIDSYFNILRTV